MLQPAKGKSREITQVVVRDGEGLYLYSEAGTLRLEPKNARTVRITYTGNREFCTEQKPGVLPSVPFSDWTCETENGVLQLRMAELQLRIHLQTASCEYLDGQGRLLLRERSQESRELEPFTAYKVAEGLPAQVEKIVTPDGEKEVLREARKVADRQLYHTRLHLEWQEQEALYGMGQQEEGILNLRGNTVYVHQANRKIAVPMLVSSLGYGILMDTYSPMIFQDTIYGSYLYTEADPELDYYFMNGGTMNGVIRAYRKLTGKAAMLPKWAFGYLQSQERYETQEEILAVAAEYRSRGIGLDAVVLDWLSWEGDLWGQKSFDLSRFPEPGQMTQQLHEMNTHFMISVWPNMSEKSENYKEFKDKNLLLPYNSTYNALKKEGRELYWDQLNRGLFCHGVDAWWCDSSEAVTPEWGHQERREPAAMYREFCEAAGNLFPEDQRNVFCLYHAQAIYEGQRKEQEQNGGTEKRVVNLTRSGYTGQQRYGTILWSGDTEAKWSTLKKQIANGLSFSASGLPYWTADIGAFFVKKGNFWYWDGDFEEGSADPCYRELFVRWYQWGAFLPVFRGHGTDCRRELWSFGEAGEPFYEALLAANRLRYRLMPYIYSLAGSVWLHDESMILPLAFYFPEDSHARDIKDQYFFGSSLMVCPVTEPMYYGKGSVELPDTPKTRLVYLPQGSNWYDYRTGAYYAGGQWITAECPLESIPLFVREGAVIPETEPAQSVAELSEKRILNVYTGKDCYYSYYEDAGDGYAYEKGEYREMSLFWSEQEQQLHVHGMKQEEYKNYKINIIKQGMVKEWRSV